MRKEKRRKEGTKRTGRKEEGTVTKGNGERRRGRRRGAILDILVILDILLVSKTIQTINIYLRPPF